jgi:hypothetical protein
MKTVKLLLARGVYAPFCVSFSFFLSLSILVIPLTAQSVYWDFTGGSRSGNSSAGYLQAGTASTGPGVSTSGFPDEACSNGEPWSVRGWYNTNSLNDAVNNGDYVSFSLSVSAGQAFHINGISFVSNRSVNAGGDEFGPSSWAVFSSADGYASPLFTGSNSTGTTGTSAPCSFNSQSLDITVQGGQGISFRLYAYGGASTEISTMRIDDLVISGSTLPVRLSYFTAREEEEGVRLSWQTYHEESNDYMAVERSVDGYQFGEIGRVDGAGTTKLSQDYYFVDDDPSPGVNYYRLRQVDFDGAEQVHRVVSVRVRSKENRIRFFPTLAIDHLTVHYPQVQAAGKLIVLNTLGRAVRQIDVPSGALQQQFNIAALLPGTYILQHWEGRKVEVLGRFVKQ